MIIPGDGEAHPSPEPTIFDPGGSFAIDDTCMSYVRGLIAAAYPEVKRSVCVIREGVLGINGETKHVCSKILLDSGALTSSYISEELVDRYAGVLQGG